MAVKPIPDEYHSLQTYLIVEGAPSLMEFLKATFDAENLGSMPTPEGKIGHAEMRIGDTVVMRAHGPTAEEVSGAMPSTVVAYVEDCDKVYQRALEAGAMTLREPQDMFYGDRGAGVVDRLGNHWWIHTHIEDVSEEEMMRCAREQDDS
jgi:PhnB protein